MHIAVQDLSNLLATYGYWAVLIFVAIESTGVPFPGETMLLTAAIYAGSTHRLDIFLVVAAAAAGAILGDNLGYVVGREGGYRLLRRFGRYIHVRERELKLGQYLFMRHGGKVVFFGRFVSILRTYAAFLAGVNRMPYARFFAFNAAGGILWATLYGFGGFILGKSVNRFTGPLGIVTAAAAVIIIIASLIILKRNFNRLEDEAERALPGPLGQSPRRARTHAASGKQANLAGSESRNEPRDAWRSHEDNPDSASEDTPTSNADRDTPRVSP